MSQRQPNDEQGTRVACTQNNLDWKEVDELLEDLPSGIPILSPEDAGNFAKYTNRPAHLYAQGDGWKNCARALEQYDAELCKGYREEIDTLLVFAGLFSAVVTAFAVESYDWLQSDANDAIVVLLSQIAQSASPNSSAAPLIPVSAGLPGSVSIRINVYWFLALALSLTAALVAILCKQWIREFERNTGLTPKQFVGIHQTKLEGLQNWRVGGIISLLPLLLQLALAFFALGVLELLWHLNSVVAIVVCVPTFVAFLFYGITTLLPALQYPHFKLDGPLSWWQRLSECPYKSPQAMLAFRARDFCLWLQHTIVSRGSYVLSLAYYHITTGLRVRRDVSMPYFEKSISPQYLGFESWHAVSLYANYRLDFVCDQPERPRPTSPYRSLRWLGWNLNDGDIAEWIWHCVWETATAREPGDDDALRQALHYVSFGSVEVPAPASGARALALGELTMTGARHAFVVEAFVQNLALLDPPGAAYLAELLAQMPGLRLDLQSAAAILRAAAAYARARVREDIGAVLIGITSLVAVRSDHAAALCDGMLVLYLSWLRAQPAPYAPETVAATEKAVVTHCTLLLEWPDDYAAHPRLLRRRPRVRALAALLVMCADMFNPPEDPGRADALAARLFAASAEQMRPIVRELLDIAAQDVHSDLPRVSPPSSPHRRVHFQGAWTERGLSAPTLRNAASHARQPDACRSSPAAADLAGRDGFASDGSETRGGVTLRAVVVHVRGSIPPGRGGEAPIVDHGAVGITHDRRRAEGMGRDEPALPAGGGTDANG